MLPESKPALDAAATLSAPLTLPSGVTLPNRLAKAAMSELLGDARNRATPAHQMLYAAWATKGPGLLLTGNVQIDRHHMEHAGNVAIEGRQDAEQMAALRAWSAAAKRKGGQIWMQLAHAGRQTHRLVNATPKAPSAVPLALPGAKFGMPVPLTSSEIVDLIRRFGHAAAIARETGFDGVELHAAHGYLFSQFLSPRSNLRDDDWGGDLAGRARFLMETVRTIRLSVGSDFPIGIKLNSADFQRGGFDFEDSQIVAGWLDEASVDLIEISGGSYEQPKMANIDGLEPAHDPFVSKASRNREAYFARFAPEMRQRLQRAKLMVTGGFRTSQGMVDAIANDGIDMIALGRPLALDPAAPASLLRGDPVNRAQPEHRLRLGPGLLGPKSPIKLVRAINGVGSMGWYNEQIIRLSAGLPPAPRMKFLPAFISMQKRDKRLAAALEYTTEPEHEADVALVPAADIV
jgi:2,4-dienoyl-CoA reductase-like NADH-dependent reductase (Old Yellow Enzyme family)